MTEPYVRILEQEDPRLGRNVFHDPASRGFAMPTEVDRSTWHDKKIKVYNPTPNPNQPNGCCTAVAKCVQCNAMGNRVKGVILGMDFAQKLYTWETQNDPFPGAMPDQDTGSNGLASAKGAQHFGVGGAYYWLFGGADQVIQAVMDGDVVSVGTRWDRGMFNRDANGLVKPGGPSAGGHQWAAIGYRKRLDAVIGLCWWGPDWKYFLIARQDLGELLADDGDAHVQERVSERGRILI